MARLPHGKPMAMLGQVIDDDCVNATVHQAFAIRRVMKQLRNAKSDIVNVLSPHCDDSDRDV
jgi:hypothetical protein